ncbi:hypothetical protein EV192_101303 [Actinocrispum wychmicini]|uniref:Uncharacterized protein n=1 Tax=Actinocrispum wychmicini TaxID=1213861 RepID=A0A4R2JYW0_9PSEU|nr:hypothetical protein EV192_101303 [Actinocrispum wychmicini]
MTPNAPPTQHPKDTPTPNHPHTTSRPLASLHPSPATSVVDHLTDAHPHGAAEASGHPHTAFRATLATPATEHHHASPHTATPNLNHPNTATPRPNRPRTTPYTASRPLGHLLASPRTTTPAADHPLTDPPFRTTPRLRRTGLEVSTGLSGVVA